MSRRPRGASDVSGLHNGLEAGGCRSDARAAAALEGGVSLKRSGSFPQVPT